MSRLSSVEDLKSKFCSTVANDIMLVSTLGVIRMWADEASRKSRFRILFTTYQERKLPAPCIYTQHMPWLLYFTKCITTAIAHVSTLSF